MAHEQSTSRLNSLYIANRFWNCAERSEMVKTAHIFHFLSTATSSASNTLDIPFIFLLLGMKTMKIVMHCHLTMGKDAANLGQSHSPHFRRFAISQARGKFNFYETFLLLKMKRWIYLSTALYWRRNAEKFLRTKSQVLVHSWILFQDEIEWSIVFNQLLLIVHL